MDLKDLYVPVEVLPNPDIEMGIEVPSGMKNVVRVTKPDGTKRTVNYCSDIYHLVKNEDIIPKFQETISKYYDVEASCRIRDWSKFFVDFIIKDKSVSIIKSDALQTRIRMINSYDGSAKYQFYVSFWRQVCSNGMMGWADSGHRVKKMHTPAIGKEVEFSKIMEMTSLFIADMADNSELYKELADHELSRPYDRIEEVLEETSFPSSLAEDVVQRFEIEKDILGVKLPNDWLVYNAFNYQLNHNEDVQTKEQKRDKIDVEVLDYLINY